MNLYTKAGVYGDHNVPIETLRYLWRPEGAGSSGAGVAGGCKLPNIGAGNSA